MKAVKTKTLDIDTFCEMFARAQRLIRSDEFRGEAWWFSEDFSKIIYGTDNPELRKLIDTMQGTMEDGYGWISKVLYLRYSEVKTAVSIEGVGEWEISFPSQLYDFLMTKKTNLIPDSKVVVAE